MIAKFTDACRNLANKLPMSTISGRHTFVLFVEAMLTAYGVNKVSLAQMEITRVLEEHLGPYLTADVIVSLVPDFLRRQRGEAVHIMVGVLKNRESHLTAPVLMDWFRSGKRPN